MKYSSKNPPLVCMMTQSTCYKGTKEMTVKGVLWHSTGCNNKTVKRYVQPSDNDPNKDELIAIIGKNKNGNDWNHKTRKAGVNAFIGTLADGSVSAVQVMPWNYAPWGCGKGSKGTCNDHWIQFEICEDSLTSKEYFDKIYQEAVELTAYLCKINNLDPLADVAFAGQKVPSVLCHKDSYKLKLGSNHSDIYHWFEKYGKSMVNVREDVAALMREDNKAQEIFRVRKDWADAASQKGAYKDFEKAKAACDKAGAEYEVYNQLGEVVYPEIVPSAFEIGDRVQIIPEAKVWVSNKSIPAWVKKSVLFVREVRRNGDVVVSTKDEGAVTGTIAPQYLIPYVDNTKKVKVTASKLNIRSGPSSSTKIVGTYKKNTVVEILEEDGNWLKTKKGWIHKSYTTEA